MFGGNRNLREEKYPSQIEATTEVEESTEIALSRQQFASFVYKLADDIEHQMVPVEVHLLPGAPNPVRRTFQVQQCPAYGNGVSILMETTFFGPRDGTLITLTVGEASVDAMASGIAGRDRLEQALRAAVERKRGEDSRAERIADEVRLRAFVQAIQ